MVAVFGMFDLLVFLQNYSFYTRIVQLYIVIRLRKGPLCHFKFNVSRKSFEDNVRITLLESFSSLNFVAVKVLISM